VPSMIDVAKLAGVSHQTVSRAINRPDTVRPEIRERIMSAIEQLGYRRNLSARALVTNQTRNLGLVDSGSSIPGHASMLMAIETAAREHDYATTVAVVANPKSDAIAAAFTHLMDRGVQGIIVLANTTGLADAARRVPADVPVVMVAGGMSSKQPMRTVGVRQEEGAQLATIHLIEQGYTRIAHLAGPKTWLDAHLRVQGWASELQSRGLAVEVLGTGDWSAASGYRIGLEQANNLLPEAVFASNDQMALGFMLAMHRRGVRIPSDIAIVGFDDQVGSDFFYPPLTTVRQPFSQVGHTAIDVLLRALAGAPSESHSVSPELVVRESSLRVEH
jgi:DNA-binding LacI/PurR family transcriptional regulator